jgi:peptidoglycan hydrolase CwlO-like protein
VFDCTSVDCLIVLCITKATQQRVMTSSGKLSTEAEADLKKLLLARDAEIEQLQAQLSQKDEEIKNLSCRVEWLEKGIDQMQKPRTHRGIGISAEPPIRSRPAESVKNSGQQKR